MMQKAVVLSSALQLLSVSTAPGAFAKGFSADAAVSIDVVATGNGGAQAGAENTAAAEVSSEFEVTGNMSGAPAPDLVRQDLIPVGTYVRTCDCKAVKSVVCICPHTSLAF